MHIHIIQQRTHWKKTHKYLCKPDEYIPGTKIKTSTEPAPNPLDPALHHPQGRTGLTKRDPLQAFMYFKYEKSGEYKARLIKPGKLTPYINRSRNKDPGETEFPYEGLENQQVMLEEDGGKCRHIASYSLEELRKMKWDGAMYQGETYKGVWVPFVSGYDSDPGQEYEDFDMDVDVARREGVAGLDDVGKYIMMPGLGGDGQGSLVQLQAPVIPRTNTRR